VPVINGHCTNNDDSFEDSAGQNFILKRGGLPKIIAKLKNQQPQPIPKIRAFQATKNLLEFRVDIRYCLPIN
jgi:hypothetical protein